MLLSLAYSPLGYYIFTLMRKLDLRTEIILVKLLIVHGSNNSYFLRFLESFNNFYYDLLMKCTGVLVIGRIIKVANVAWFQMPAIALIMCQTGDIVVLRSMKSLMLLRRFIVNLAIVLTDASREWYILILEFFLDFVHEPSSSHALSLLQLWIR